MRNRLINLTVPIPVEPNYTGRVLVSVENGKPTKAHKLFENEFTGSFESFLEAAKLAGYQVIPPAA